MVIIFGVKNLKGHGRVSYHIG